MSESIKAKINRSDIPEEYREAFDMFKDDIYVEACYILKNDDIWYDKKMCAVDIQELCLWLDTFKRMKEDKEGRNETND